jgi:hypothetical protein
VSAVAHQRKFGVEIECGYNGNYSYRGWEEVERKMKEAKFPVKNRERYQSNRKFALYSVGRDGSGVEVRTPILAGNKGFDELKRIFAFLNNLGCYTGTNDGMHVHHDAPELVKDPLLTRNLVKSWVANRHAICEMVTPYRRSRMVAWTADSLESLDDWAEGNQTHTDSYGYTYPITFGRNELNIASLIEHGTIEFRLHEGTLNIDDAIAWIKFGQRFMDSVLHRARPMANAGNRQDLLNRIRLSKTQQAKLDAKRVRIYGAA